MYITLNMDEYLTISCELENCESCFNYPHDGESIGGIIAVQCSWFEKEQKGNQLLVSSPQIGRTYTLSFKDPLKLSLKNDFWVFYVDPISQINGIETQEGLDSIRYCKCSSLTKDSEKQLTVAVKDVFELKDIKSLAEENELPDIWASMASSTIMLHSNRMNFGDFEILSVDLEGDAGLTLIAKHEKLICRIILINDWDFHRNVYYLTNIKLNKHSTEESLQQTIHSNRQ